MVGAVIFDFIEGWADVSVLADMAWTNMPTTSFAVCAAIALLMTTQSSTLGRTDLLPMSHNGNLRRKVKLSWIRSRVVVGGRPTARSWGNPGSSKSTELAPAASVIGKRPTKSRLELVASPVLIQHTT